MRSSAAVMAGQASSCPSWWQREPCPATSSPTVHAPCMTSSHLPRVSLVHSSANSVTAIGAPPSAKPTTERSSSSHANEGASALASPAAPRTTAESRKPRRRPSWSATAPRLLTPSSMPGAEQREAGRGSANYDVSCNNACSCHLNSHNPHGCARTGKDHRRERRLGAGTDAPRAAHGGAQVRQQHRFAGIRQPRQPAVPQHQPLQPPKACRAEG